MTLCNSNQNGLCCIDVLDRVSVKHICNVERDADTRYNKVLIRIHHRVLYPSVIVMIRAILMISEVKYNTHNILNQTNARTI